MKLSAPNAVAPTIQYAAPSAGNTVNFGPNSDFLLLEPALTLATLTVALPSTNLYNGRKVCFSSSQIITALTLSAVNTIAGAITSLALGGAACYTYSTVQNAWYRI